MLPAEFSSETYWADIYRKPVSFWLPAIDFLAQKYGLGDDWARARLGRNVVLLNANFVIKLGPPCWPGDMDNEVSVLPWIGGKLAVATPQLLGSGAIDGWSYIIEGKLSGQNLHELWTGLSGEQRVELALQHGEILKALHNLPVDTLGGSKVAFDWEKMYGEQRKVCQEEMAARGVPTALVEDTERYLEKAAPLMGDEGSSVLLHGDLTHLNLLVKERGGGWEISGLIDWGDAKLGPRGHEFISPGVHMYRGERAALEAFYRGGYRGNPRDLMARAMLYYTGDFAAFLREIPGAGDCRSWECVEGLLW